MEQLRVEFADEAELNSRRAGRHTCARNAGAHVGNRRLSGALLVLLMLSVICVCPAQVATGPGDAADTQIGLAELPAAMLNYTIKPNDALDIVLWQAEALVINARVVVADTGTITLPQVGQMAVGGKTVGDIRYMLKRAYQPLYPGATLLVMVPGTGEGRQLLAPEEAGDVRAVIPERLLRPADGIVIRCWTGDKEFVHMAAIISNDGTMMLPPFGTIQATQFTTGQLQDYLSKRYQSIYPRSAVEVRPLSGEEMALWGKYIAGREQVTPEALYPETGRLYPPDVDAGVFFNNLPRFGTTLFKRALKEPAERYARSLPPTPTESEVGAAELLASVPVPSDYLLGPGDELAIRSWTGAVEHYADTAVVSQQGTIYIALLGEMAVGGVTLAEFRQILKQRFAHFYQDAQVTVTMARIRTIDVYLTGDANRPGRYTLSGTATVFSALYEAGGPSDIGSLRNIVLLRGKQPARHIDLYDYLLDGESSADVALEPGDTIFVRPAGDVIGIAGQVRRPARYETAPNTSLADAIKMSGALQAAGYAPNVEVWRVAGHADRHVINVDLTKSGDEFIIQNGDLVLVRPVVERPANAVELIGAVKRPGIYEVGEGGLTLSQLLSKAQGPSDSAYIKQGSVWRLNDDNIYEMHAFNVKLAMAGDAQHSFGLVPNDKVFVYEQEEVLQPRQVIAGGSVGNPGMFSWVAGMRVSDLLLQARGVLPNAYVERAELLRIGPDKRPQLIPVSLTAIAAGDATADMVLQPGDRLTVYDRMEREDTATISVSGFVNKPAEYTFYEGLRVSDAIYLAGGLRPEAADTIIYSQGNSTNETQTLRLRLTRNGKEFTVEPDITLGDYDHVAVQGSGDIIVKPRVAAIEGRVQKPGVYTLHYTEEEPETVYKLLQKAGGVSDDANPNGIIVYRRRGVLVAGRQGDNVEDVMRTFNRELSSQTTDPRMLTQAEKEGAVGGQIGTQLASVFGDGSTISVVTPPRLLNAKQWAQAIPVDGQALIRTKGREGDVELRNGDVVVVPRISSVVSVLGTVARPGALRYQEGKTWRDYIQQSGGTASDAMVSRIVVIRTNGQVELAQTVKDIRPGDVILVPSQYQVRMIQKDKTWVRVTKTLIGIAAAILVF